LNERFIFRFWNHHQCGTQIKARMLEEVTRLIGSLPEFAIPPAAANASTVASTLFASR
jgi:hypothetical protein